MSKISNRKSVTPKAMQERTYRTKNGGRPRPMPTGAAPYSITKVVVISVRVAGRERLNIMAGMTGRMMAIRPNFAHAATRCFR